MRRRWIMVPMLCLAAGCTIGPHYHPEAVVPADTKVGAAREPDSARTFLDSLARARAADSLTPAPIATRTVRPEQIADLAWLDILRDSTLIGLVDTALHRNRDLAVAEARIREFRADVGLARSGLFPQLTVNGSASKNQIAFGTQTFSYDALRLTGDVAWELDFWGRVRNGLTAANADLAAQRAAEKSAVLSLVSDVATGYLQLLELDQERAIALRTLASRKETYELARQRYTRGVISELDVRQFEAQLAVPAARLAQVEQLQAQQEHALNVLLGEAPTPIARGTTLAAAAAAVTIPDSIPSALLARRPDVQQAERSYAAAVARAGMAEAARLPTISITASYGRQSGSASTLFKSSSEVYQLMAGVSIPIFTGGRLENAAAAAKARADQARAAYERTELVALREASDALTGVRAARDQLTAQETQANALRRALELATLRYQTGVASYLDVLDVQRNLFDAELALSQAQLHELTSAVQLYKALGGSWDTGDRQTR